MEREEKVATQCPHCMKRFAVRSELVGRRVKCAGCGEAFEIEEIAEGFVAPTRARVRDEVAGMAPPFSPSVKSAAARPVWLEPKWIVAAVAVLAILVGGVILKRVFSSTAEMEGLRNDSQANSNRSTPVRSSADSAVGTRAEVKPVAPAPVLTWVKDDVGRAVGTATAAMRSAGTQVRVVLPPGDHAAGSLPCVFICPAGSNLLTGVPWGDDEQRDFYGLLERGMAVCFYTLDGTVADYKAATDLTMAMKMQAYLQSGGGLGNFQDAIDTVLAGTPAVDAKRLGAMGHSSAGTVALTGAGADSRIAAVAAMAPALDLPKRLAAVVEQLPSNATQRLYLMSPSMIEKLSADVFIFQADDDKNTPAADAVSFAEKHAEKVKLQRIATGGHGGAYSQGIGPCMDFLAAKFGAKAMAGAGRVTAGSLSGPAVTPVAPPVVPGTPAADQDTKPAARDADRVIDETYWYKRRGNGVIMHGAGSFILAADWPRGFAAGGDRRGATYSIQRSVADRKTLGIRVLVAPDASLPRLVSGQGLLPAEDGKVGIDVTHQRIVLPSTEAKVVPAMGGGKIAIFDCGDDMELGLPTREAVIALEYEGKVVLIHLAVPRKNAADLDKLIASVRVWGLRGKKESVAAPYSEVKAVAG